MVAGSEMTGILGVRPANWFSATKPASPPENATAVTVTSPTRTLTTELMLPVRGIPNDETESKIGPIQICEFANKSCRSNEKAYDRPTFLSLNVGKGELERHINDQAVTSPPSAVSV